jgi:threonine dehydrogenase-like Zn-dependent dehydrogenase
LGRLLLGLTYNRCTGSVPLFRAGPVRLQPLAQEPLPGQSWVRVGGRLAGVCGSDMNLLRLQFSTRSASMARKRALNRPFCLGHEAIGEVVELGANVRTLAVGQRVVLLPGASCAGMERTPPCALCEQGLPLLCLHRDEFRPPLDWGAGWSEQFVRPASQLIPVPDKVRDEHAVLVEPLACSLHAVLRRVPSPADSVIVMGCGTIGLGMVLALRALSFPVHIIAIAKYTYQASQARALGANRVLLYNTRDLYDQLAAELGTEVWARGPGNRLLHQGASVVYDAVGSSESLQHALRWVRPRGAVVVEGITTRAAPLDCTVIWLREVDLIGSHGHGLEHFENRAVHTFNLVLEWIEQRRLVPDGLVTHRYPLSEYAKAIRAATGKGRSQATKVLLELNTHDPTLP